MRNNNRLPYKGRDNLEIDKTEISYPSLGDTIDDVFTDINNRIENPTTTAFAVMFYVGLGYGVWCVLHGAYVGVMTDIQTAAIATVETRQALSLHHEQSDVGVFVGEVWLPLSIGAIAYRIFMAKK